MNTHFARAIRKYGAEHFSITKIDEAKSQDELNFKERYWISFYDSIKNGYNETDATYKSGGNTYQSKNEEDMQNIADKLSKSKMGKKNPNAKQIKCKNVITNEEIFFNTVKECKDYFKEKHHRFITTRITNQTRGLYRGEWAFAYIDEDYIYEMDVHKKGRRLKVFDINNDKDLYFESIRNASSELGINRSKIETYIRNGESEFEIDNYKITILN